MDCYILGAGASKCYNESPTKEKMPLANEVFKVYNNLEIASNLWVLVGYVLNYVKDRYGIDPTDFMNFNEDIEVMHSEVHNKNIDAQKRNDILGISRYNAVDNQLLFLFVSIINEIQNGPVSIPHLNFVNTLEKKDSIITFNWDTLIDRALYSRGDWFTDSGYIINPRRIFRDQWVLPENKESVCELIKLHGSTNWLTSHPIWEDEKMKFTHLTGDNDVFVFEYATKEYACYDGRYMPDYAPFSYGYYPPNLFVEALKAKDGHVIARLLPRTGYNPKGNASSDGIVSIPLIIAPVKEKEYGRFGDLFSILWNNAKKRLVESDRIFIIGYSFPKTDIRTTELFLSAFTERKNIPEIVIVNPFPESIVTKFSLEFGIPSNNIYVDKCYIDEKYNFAKWKK